MSGSKRKKTSGAQPGPLRNTVKETSAPDKTISTGESSRKKQVLVEGWRSTSHSYAVVNQWQTIAFGKRGDLGLHFKDVDYFNPNWTPIKGLFAPDHESFLAGLTDADAAACDAVVRVSFPLNFSGFSGKKTVIYGTSEHKSFPQRYFRSYEDFKSSIGRSDVTAWTSSRWSAEGFYRQGFSEDQVAIVPHGVDVASFYPSPETRDRVRKQLGLSGFVFMSIGSMTSNKGIDLLLKAFAAVIEKRPDVRLFLKGADGLYSSNKMLESYLSGLTAAERERVQQHCVYHGGFLSMADMAALYQVADAYVSPYRAEGFNIPVLEAAACGVPVICSAGGSTDDFVTDDFARRINSKVVTCVAEGESGEMLSPDLDHLIHQMLTMVDDEAWRKRAALAAVEHTKTRFTWDIVTDRIVKLLF
jgi:glycosyltransferase involved in cell wall biosynthesis